MTDDKKETTASNPPVLPLWFTTGIINPLKAGIASVFILHGETNGLWLNPDQEEEPNKPYILLRELLEKVLGAYEMVIFYDIASGVSFLTPEMKERFKKLNGSNDPDDGAKPSAVVTARAKLQAKRDLPTDPTSCLSMIEKVLKEVPRTAVIIQSAHFIAPESVGAGAAASMEDRINIERLRNWSQNLTIRSNQGLVILLTDLSAKISLELRGTDSEIRSIGIPKPDQETRKDFVRTMTADSSTYRLPADCDPTLFALAAQGLSLRQLSEVFISAAQEGRNPDLNFLKNTKRRILNEEFGEVLEVVIPQRGFEDIGGHEHIKRYFGNILAAISRGENRLVPMGVTLMGPPGTGKTAFVEALAFEAGFNFVKMKNLRSMWIGQSEARQEMAITALRSLAPVAVMNDEADLNEAQRDAYKGDSGVSERMMKAWMEFLSDPRIRGQVIVINCTNRPDRLDAALKRSGRSDERILVPMPADDEFPVIFRVMFARHAIPIKPTDFSVFTKAAKQKRLSGADIEKIVLKAFAFAQRRTNNERVQIKDLRAAIDDFIPSADQFDIDAMTMAGLMASSSKELLPNNVNDIVIGIRDRALLSDVEGQVTSLAERGIISVDSVTNTA
jgi:SpoVK/Ycf46/Vps4 family AAA+-type ATPase